MLGLFFLLSFIFIFFTFSLSVQDTAGASAKGAPSTARALEKQRVAH